MKIFKKIIYTSLTIAVLVILPALIITLITSKTTLIPGFQSFVVLTGSMEPTIPTGSVIYTKKKPWYPEGSIIAFKNGDVTVTHRVVKVTNRKSNFYYQTRGDANNSIDEKELIASDILGKEFVYIPYIGKAITFLKTPQGFFPLIIFPITVFIVLEIWNLKKEIEKVAEKKFRSKLLLTKNE